MRLIPRLALRLIRARPAAAFVTVLGVALGVAGVRAMSLGADGAISTLRATFAEAAGPASWVALPAGDPRVPIPAEVVARLSLAPGLRGVLPLLTVPTVRMEELRLWMGVVLPQGSAGLLALGVDPTAEEGMGRWVVAEGEAMPRCGGEPGVCKLDGAGLLVGEAWAAERGLGPGDPLRFVLGSRVVETRIAGTVERQGLGARGYGRVLIAPIAALGAAAGVPPGSVHELGLRLDETGLQAEEDDPMGLAPTTLVEAAGPGVALLRPGDRGSDVVQKLANMRAGTDLLSGITLLLSALLIAGQFASRATERARLIGLLCTIGATPRQAAAVFLTEALLLAIPGALLGLALGAPLAHGVAFALGQGAQADLRVGGFDAGGAALALSLGLGVALARALVPALRAGRSAPLEATRARAAAAESPPMGLLGLAGLLLLLSSLSLWWDPAEEADRAWTLTRVLLGLSASALALPVLVPPFARLCARACRLDPALSIGVSGLRWRPVRSGLAAGAVLLTVAMAGGVGALGSGLGAEMKGWSERALGFDLYASRPDGFTDAELVGLRGLPGVEEAVGVSIRPVTVELGGKPASLSLFAIDPAAWARADLLPVVNADGSPVQGGAAVVASLADDRGLLVPTIVAAQFGVEVGDRVILPGREGPVELSVRGLVVDYTQNGFTLLISDSLLRETQGGDHVDLVAIRGDARGAVEAIPGVVVESRDELQGRIQTLLAASLGALDALAWLSGLIGVLAVVAALSQSAIERRVDMALLRAVGLERRQLGRLLAAEGFATAVLGVLPGIPVGVGLGWVFAAATHTLGISLPYTPAWGPMIGASVAALLSATLAAWLPARRAGQGSPMEALRD